MLINPLTSTPVNIGDGSKKLHVTCNEKLNTGERLFYGFGSADTDTWHPYFPKSNDPLNIATGFGAVFLKTQVGKTMTVSITVGV